ncbi:energy transducer TonB [Fibrobacter sp. UWEL]|uniref:energy transducer TonB family protein n=1 Tax=Fibrobacter sp. UWEL TaxID=1896209 RepID=UPI000914C1C3|nr:energy transducer TonB [Fibrobacter sp. UWEL]SHL13240.1 TonB family C-terminal domain-containing protein [Fibrobacter sp. UWEL]
MIYYLNAMAFSATDFIKRITLALAAVFWSSCSDVEKAEPKQTEIKKSESADSTKRESFKLGDKKIDRVLKTVEGLNTTGTTLLYGVPRPRPEMDSLLKFCFENPRDSICISKFKQQAKGIVKIPSKDDVKMTEGKSQDLVTLGKTIFQRAPGLRHIYNKHLRRAEQNGENHDFEATLVMQITVVPGGQVTNVEVLQSSSGHADFDEEIKKALSRWKFDSQIKDTLEFSIPLEFLIRNPDEK